MAKDIEVFYSMLYDLIENTILTEGWLGCENELRGLLVEKRLKKVKTAFSAAIMKSCKEYIPEILINFRVPDRFEEYNKIPNFYITSLTNMSPKQTIAVYMSGGILSRKEKEKEAYKSMLLKECRAVYHTKERLELRIYLIKEQSYLLDFLLEKAENVKREVQKNSLLLK